MVKNKKMIADKEPKKMVEALEFKALCFFKENGDKYKAGDVYTGKNIKELKAKGLIG